MSGIDVAALISAAFLAGVWAGYPCAIGLLARLASRRTVSRPCSPRSVSVIVASRDSADAVRSRLANLLATEARISEIIVARDAQASELPLDALDCDVIGEVPVIVVRGHAPGGKAGALNAGVELATGEVLVFADTHQRFQPGTIPALLEELDDPRVGIVSGSLELPASVPSVVKRYWRLERSLRRNEASVHSAIGVTGAVYAMRRTLWRPLPPALILDDVYTPMRLVLEGHRVGFAPAAVALETRAPSPGQEYNRKVRTLTGVMQLCAWLPALLVPVRNPVWIQFVCHKLLRMLTPYAAAILAIWALTAALRLPAPGLLGLLAVAATSFALLGFIRPPLLRKLRDAAAEGLLLQAAVVVAGVNGIRGRWQVWDA